MLGDRSSLISSWHLLDAVAEGLKHCDRDGSCVHRDQPVALHHNLQWGGAQPESVALWFLFNG